MISRIVFSTEAMGLALRSGYQTPAELKEAEKIMSVAMAQPHRVGVSNVQGDALMASALGRFCMAHWNDKGAQWDRWLTGERYAQLIDADRIARGWPPRQCAVASGMGEATTLAEAIERRQRASNAIEEANAEMRAVDRDAPGAICRLAWEDRGIADQLHEIAYQALYRLAVHFERLDKPKSRV